MKENKFKQNIKTNQVQYGVWNGLADTYVAEILAGSGFDWILIDGEHAPFDLRTISHNCKPSISLMYPCWFVRIMATNISSSNY